MAPQVKDPKYLEKLARMNFYGKEGSFSLDNARAIYKWYLRNGLITGNLRKKTYDEFLAHVKSKMRLVEGKTARVSLTQILNEEAGGKYNGFKLTVNEDDIQNIGVDKRHYNTQVLGPIQEEFFTQKYGAERVKQYKAAVTREKNAMTALNRLLREKYGKDFHQGHFMPSASSLGGAYGLRGTSPEPAKPNMLQGAQPRANIDALQETGRSFSRVDDFYQWDLETKNLGPLGSKALTPADLFAIEKGADPNQILLARQRNIDLGLDIGDGSNYTEGMLRTYYGDQNFDDYLSQVQEGISRQAMQTGVNPATNKPLTPQEKVNTALLERPSERSRRKSIFGAAPTQQGGRLVRSGGAIKYLPLVPIGLGVVTAAQQVKAGDLSGAGGTVIDTVMGETPGLEYFVPEPTALGTLDANRNMPTPDDKPSYALPPEQRDFSRVGTQKP